MMTSTLFNSFHALRSEQAFALALSKTALGWSGGPAALT